MIGIEVIQSCGAGCYKYIAAAISGYIESIVC